MSHFNLLLQLTFQGHVLDRQDQLVCLSSVKAGGSVEFGAVVSHQGDVLQEFVEVPVLLSLGPLLHLLEPHGLLDDVVVVWSVRLLDSVTEDVHLVQLNALVEHLIDDTVENGLA